MNSEEREMLKEGNKSIWRFWKSVLYTLGTLFAAAIPLSIIPITPEGLYFVLFLIVLVVIFYCTFTILDEIRKR
ncbi:hypothetical protein [Proteiniclasticum ruminis]|uniref:Uncharacterized protein n=1 Tax=Proteiniclasticum ruminis TaxID=398199 RepID=A0A1I5D8T0_9CLOT|nr:hypothetical protein [Proteiniclasticum ruminis]SFN95526.1 hypothetical protein SAMN04488695_10899 [Proteiniclasticum ruminis]